MTPFSEFLRRILAYGLESQGLYYGIYRGVVKDNQDPDNYGRVKVHVPQIHGDSYPDVWAWPKAAWAGNKCGFFMIPDVGQTVYVVFDHGRPDKPLWDGGWWGKGDPHPDMKHKQILLITPEGLRFHLDRVNKVITLAIGTDKEVRLTESQATFKHPSKVVIEAPSTTVEADNIKLNGNTEIQGTLNVSDRATMANATIAGKDFATHRHTSASSGSPTSPPI